MKEQQTPEDLYAIVENIFPEPGINRPAVMKMIEAANALGEGPVMYLAQMTAEMVREIFSRQHTFHATINDYEFSKRLLDALRKSPPTSQ